MRVQRLTNVLYVIPIELDGIVADILELRDDLSTSTHDSDEWRTLDSDLVEFPPFSSFYPFNFLLQKYASLPGLLVTWSG